MPPYSFLFVKSSPWHRSWLASPQHYLLSPSEYLQYLGPETLVPSLGWSQLFDCQSGSGWDQDDINDTLHFLGVSWEQNIISLDNSDLIYKSVVSWLDTDNPVFTFSSRALDISQHVQSESYPSRGKDQKRKLLCHRHFCNEFAANNRPEDKEMTLFTNPTFWVSIIILLLCFVLLRFIQVYSVFSRDCIHSITRVKMIESLLCASRPIVTDAPDWYWIVCLSTLGAMFISLWTISADCLFQIPTHPSHSEGMVTFSLTWYQSPVWGPQAWRCMLTCSMLTQSCTAVTQVWIRLLQ